MTPTGWVAIWTVRRVRNALSMLPGLLLALACRGPIAPTPAPGQEPTVDPPGGHGVAVDTLTVATAPPLSPNGVPFKMTYYYIALRPHADPDEVPLIECGTNTVLTMASRKFAADALLEGTARFWSDALGESFTINLGGPKCFIRILDWGSRWGLGVWDPVAKVSYPLRPFRSIAIDRRVLTMGKWYYVKDFDGARMPYPVSTMTHDGCVRAVDVGGGIVGRHIDWYVAYATAYRWLVGATPGSTSAVKNRYTVTLFEADGRCAKHQEGP